MSIFGRSPREEAVLIERYLQAHKIGKDAFIIRIIPDEKIQSPADYFEAHDVDSTPWTVEEAKTAELKHRLSSRMIILWTLVIPMSVAPFWLMVLLSLPAFKLEVYSEKMQAAFLAGLVSDFAGLYYVVTRDLFPRDSLSHKKGAKPEAKGKTDDDQ